MIDDDFLTEEAGDTVADFPVLTAGLPITDALDQLRLRLLDLTGRNRLINFKHGAGKTIQFVESDFNAAFERLVGDSASGLALGFVPDPDRQDWELKNGRPVRPEAKSYASRLGKNTSYDLLSGKTAPARRTRQSTTLQTLYYADELGKYGRKLAREAKLAIEETGSNMLYLVFGFLEFPESPGSDKLYQAPLLCVPVSIAISDEGQYSTFTVVSSGEELTDNLSLREKVKRDFGLNLPPYLDEDDESADSYLVKITRQVKDLPGWRVQYRITLSLLSFANMLMVKDIAPETWDDGSGTSTLVSHPLIRQVFEGNDSRMSEPAYAGEYDIDIHPGGDLPLIYDADSSQHSALIDVLDGKNRVIEGPPGTGKSQTITNIIAAALQAGKTVLFVAEKLAALEVVKSRLEQAGLEKFVLELHSNKTNKKRVLDDLKHRIEMSVPPLGELPEFIDQLSAKKDELRSHMEVMRSVGGNAMELSLHQVMWRAELNRVRCAEEAATLIHLEYAPAAATTQTQLLELVDGLKYAVHQYDMIGKFDNSHPFWGFFPNELTPHDAIPIQQILTTYRQRFAAFDSALGRALDILGTDDIRLDNETASRLISVLSDLAPADPAEIDFQLLPALFGSDDAQGRQSLDVLKELSARQELLSGLEQSRDEVMIDSSAVDQDEISAGENIGKRLASIGLGHWTCEQLAHAQAKLRAATNAGALAARDVERIALLFGIPFDYKSEDIKRVQIIRSVLGRAPTLLLHLRSAELAEPMALDVLNRMASELEAIQSAFAMLDDALYMDSVPAEGEISDAIAVLREGNRWYRVFQGNWRKSIALHKRLVRDKNTGLSPEERLAGLEALRKYTKRQSAWQNDEKLRRICGPHFDGASTPFMDLLMVAVWLIRSNENFSDNRVESPVLDLFKITRADIVELLEVSDTLGDSLRTLDAVADLHRSLLTSVPELSANIEQARWDERLSEYHETAELLNAAVAFMTPRMKQGITFQRGVAALAEVYQIPELVQSLTTHPEGTRIFGTSYKGRDTSLSTAFAAHTYGRLLLAARLPAPLERLLLSADSVANYAAIEESIIAINQGWKDLIEFERSLGFYGEINIGLWAGSETKNLSEFARGILERTTTAVQHYSSLLPWAQYVQAREGCQRAGLMEYLDLVEANKLSAQRLVYGFTYRFYASITQQLFRQKKALRVFSGTRHASIRKDYAFLDRQVIKMRGAQVARDCMRASAPPQGMSGVRVDDKSELRLLEHLIPQQRPRVPLRKLLSRAGGAIQSLKPCFMMGPQAVAQFLQPRRHHFDIVIMDEASQLRPEQALGAIARGSQLVVVGDPKQLPPTSFFARMATPEDDGDSGKGAAAVDAESILDVCISHFHPVRTLRWHYRSQHESLIAFSNQNFYRGNLVVFPSPFGKSKELGLRYRYVKAGIYEGQMNPIEAREVVEAVAAHIQQRPENSLGVVTLNVKQRDIIAEMLRERLKTVDGADDFKEHWKSQGMELFVKNLENVQGDERDCIMISTTFGRPATAGVVRQNFGPISRNGGWRRLNVLFTRAKRSVVVFSSMKPEDIVVDRGTPEGTRALRDYLLFARDNVLSQNEETDLPPDSDFEVAILDLLKGKGYEVVPQLGVAGFRIDIAVRHPDYKSMFLAAIECDGASYHSGVSVRDRDRIRQEILEGLGWRGRIWRIWSTDWFRNPQAEAERLFNFLSELRAVPVMVVEDDPDVTEDDEQFPPELIDQEPTQIPQLAEIDLPAEDDEIDVQVGDLVTYFDVETPECHLSVRITALLTNLNQGFISEGTPLAQVLLGAMAGDDVVLRVPGKSPATLRVHAIHRADVPHSEAI
ncbi:DUF4011 domain-containing protein [Massilia violaceinigra]|uniref:DUF4011 domain-containing protein n=1 Tax=Massilia violaceinigra TaxID=2045208 RepID=A0ABY4A9W4_9BURK|nr:DUF4011 domain-containing protein [Massilia violaceinigra]UOD31595.1 DUF4011 domain-containing protein [Massilia violaceinigra]